MSTKVEMSIERFLVRRRVGWFVELSDNFALMMIKAM